MSSNDQCLPIRIERRDRIERRTEDLSVVDTNDGTDHLGNDDHVAKVGLDDLGLLTGGGGSLGLAKLLHQTERLALESTLETTTGTSVNELGEGSRVEVEELRELHVPSE
jgi:hypothetical protein